jgi:hypothetical protein
MFHAKDAKETQRPQRLFTNEQALVLRKVWCRYNFSDKVTEKVLNFNTGILRVYHLGYQV